MPGYPSYPSSDANRTTVDSLTPESFPSLLAVMKAALSEFFRIYSPIRFCPLEKVGIPRSILCKTLLALLFPSVVRRSGGPVVIRQGMSPPVFVLAYCSTALKKSNR